MNDNGKKAADPHALRVRPHDDGLLLTDSDGAEAILSIWMVRGLLFNEKVRTAGREWLLEQVPPYRLG